MRRGGKLALAGLGLAGLIILPLALGAVLLRQHEAAQPAGLPIPPRPAGRLVVGEAGGKPAEAVALPSLAAPSGQGCLDRRGWILALHSQRQVQIEECRLLSGLWTDLVTGRRHSNPDQMTVMAAIPLPLAQASGLSGQKLQAWLFPDRARGWLWMPVARSSAARRGGRSIEAWQPARPDMRCHYFRRWMAAKASYALAVTSAEAAWLRAAQLQCG